jgi:hypothetical protein
MSFARRPKNQGERFRFNGGFSESLRAPAFQDCVKAGVSVEVARGFELGRKNSLSENEASYLTTIGDRSIDARGSKTHWDMAFRRYASSSSRSVFATVILGQALIVTNRFLRRARAVSA